MSADRLTALEARLAVLERRRAMSLTVGIAGIGALVIAGHVAVTEAQSTATFRAPFQVVDQAGRPIFEIVRVGANNTRVQLLGDDGSVVAVWGAGEKGAAYLALGGKEAKGTARLAMDFNGENTGPSLLLADTSRDLLSVDNDGAEIGGALTVTDKVTVRATKGNSRTSLGTTSLSIHGADGQSVAASLGLDNLGRGRLVVGAQNGVRGALGQTKDGEMSFALYDGPGTDYRIGLLAAPKSSSWLRLKGGKREVALDVTAASSGLHLLNDAGYAVATLDVTTNGNGMFTLGNAAGDTMVEGGTTVDGLGIVRAGPRLGGTTGVSQGGMVLPHSIVGQRGR